ncbi:MAG: HlyD family efflux transporter periplasmic adaptor subunit [Microvirga sp.]
MDRQLFRQQAIDFQRHHRQWGDVASLQPLSLKVATWFVAAVVALLIGFLFVAQYARKETAVGYLTPTKGTAKVFVPRRGTVKEVHVADGDTVKEGQPLLTIETDQIAADGMDVNATQLDSLGLQKDLLAKNIKAEEQRAGSERERLTAASRGLETEIAQLRGQIKLQSERLEVTQDDVATGEQLRSKGFMTAVEFRRRQVAALEQKQVLSGLNQQLAAKQNQLTEARFSLKQLPTVMAQKVQALRNELSAAEQRIAEIKGRGAYVIRAPSSGRVSTLQATAGQNADPQRLQLEIIPEDSVLQAELFLPARAVGFVETGQAVRILYDAFPYQHFGAYRGRVAKVSQTILTSADAAGPIKLNEPAYRVTAVLERPDIDAYGKRVALQPDMLLKADIILERRSLISWLTTPLRSVRM